ncbi:MAG: acetolactate synthase large subunit [Sphingomonadales bacterium]|jgi:acetolactate synthase-1/2/3 large subunit|nr:acetolactate synthase large subunit [Sphingomonadales bacterium]MBK9005029.1 acetolactate synthase large subunit [Sphingomonadales bacterium]MBK9267238.1 acetolactate synthase large subunit [Sphingomonadales bacterium]
MNGAEALIDTLAASGVEVCFANPGTSEMQLVAAIDRQHGMRAILGLFEGVVTGAADGYGRMADKPALTLLHLGPGLANGLANLHNARRAGSPIINVVGDHATYHLQYNSPLTSDLEGVARPMSHWLKFSKSERDLPQIGAEAWSVASSYPGQVATVVVPANHAWTEGAVTAAPTAVPAAQQTPDDVIGDAAAALRDTDGPVALFLGGRALREGALEQAGRIAAATGARLLCETFTARLQRGAGRVAVERLPYFGEQGEEYLKDFKAIIFCGCEPPVSFFAYPGKPSWLSPEGAQLVRLASFEEEAESALTRLADRLGAPAQPALVQQAAVPSMPEGRLDPTKVGAVIGAMLPKDAIISDEAATAGLMIYPSTAGAPQHDWLMLTGGAIGQGLPVATGAAVACPDRKVIALQADGGGMYTPQALWTMARENLDVITIILNNGSYAILNIELMRVGVQNPGPKALSMLDLRNPALNWVSISEGMGVPAVRVETAEDFKAALEEALAHKGPRLIEVIL